MPYRNKQFWGRAFSFSPDGFSDEMDADGPALCPHQWSGPQDVRPATAADSTSPGTTAKANPKLSLPLSKDHASRSRPARASVSDLRIQLRSHTALPPCPRPSIVNQDVLTDARFPEGLRDLVLAKGFDCPSEFAFPTLQTCSFS